MLVARRFSYINSTYTWSLILPTSIHDSAHATSTGRLQSANFDDYCGKISQSQTRNEGRRHNALPCQRHLCTFYKYIEQKTEVF